MNFLRKPIPVLLTLVIGVIGLGLASHIKSQNSVFSPGSLLKCSNNPEIYYVGSDDQRYLFTDEATYKTWYPDFSTVTYTTNGDCGALNLGGVVPIKPGSLVVKSPHISRLYAVTKDRTLRHIRGEFAARNLYGMHWSKEVEFGGKVYTMPEVIFSLYKIGAPINSGNDFSVAGELISCDSINECLGLGVLPTFSLEKQDNFGESKGPINAPRLQSLLVPNIDTNDSKKSNIGINLASTAYYNNNWLFKDVFKQADPLFSGTYSVWNDGNQLEKDQFGWVMSLQPAQIAKTIVIGASENAPTGIYTILYDGEGKLEYPGANITNTSPGRDEIQVGKGGFNLYITKTNPADYIRNIRVLLPGGSCNNAFNYAKNSTDCAGNYKPFEDTYQSEPFHPIFLAEHRPFKTIRLTDLMVTNRLVNKPDNQEPKQVIDWDDYPTRSDATWSPVPVEILVNLANTLQADAYINIPHTANNNFVKTLAKVTKATLDKDLNLYVEYSNEVFNSDFEQYHWMNQHGCDMYGNKFYDGSCGNDLLNLGKKYYAVRTGEVMKIFSDVYGDETKERLTRVLGGRAGGATWYSDRQFFETIENGQRVYEYIDAYAIDPYFGTGMKFSSLEEPFYQVNSARNDVPAGTYQIIANEAKTYGDVITWIKRDIKHLNQEASLKHIKLIAFEGGQNLYGNQTPEQTELLKNINQDPRMQAVYSQFLNLWNSETNNALFIHFTGPSTWSQWGTWGSKEFQGQPRIEAPKYNALINEIEKIDGLKYPDVVGM